MAYDWKKELMRKLEYRGHKHLLKLTVRELIRKHFLVKEELEKLRALKECPKGYNLKPFFQRVITLDELKSLGVEGIEMTAGIASWSGEKFELTIRRPDNWMDIVRYLFNEGDAHDQLMLHLYDQIEEGVALKDSLERLLKHLPRDENNRSLFSDHQTKKGLEDQLEALKVKLSLYEGTHPMCDETPFEDWE